MNTEFAKCFYVYIGDDSNLSVLKVEFHGSKEIYKN